MIRLSRTVLRHRFCQFVFHLSKRDQNRQAFQEEVHFFIFFDQFQVKQKTFFIPSKAIVFIISLMFVTIVMNSANDNVRINTTGVNCILYAYFSSHRLSKHQMKGVESTLAIITSQKNSFVRSVVIEKMSAPSTLWSSNGCRVASHRKREASNWHPFLFTSQTLSRVGSCSPQGLGAYDDQCQYETSNPCEQ